MNQYEKEYRTLMSRYGWLNVSLIISMDAYRNMRTYMSRTEIEKKYLNFLNHETNRTV